MIIGLCSAHAFAAENSINQIGAHFSANSTTGVLNAQAELTGDTTKSYADGLVKTNKTITAGANENEFIVTLDVRTTETIERLNLIEDAAVVLVIDQSPSASGDRLAQAKIAATAFVESFKLDKEGVQRKIAIVGFSGQMEQYEDHGIPGAKAYLGWTDASSDSIQKTIGSLDCKATGWTCMEAGLILAKNLLSDSAVSGIANKNIVLLSDGKPTYGLTKNAQSSLSTDEIGTAGTDFFRAPKVNNHRNYTTHTMHENIEMLAEQITKSGIHTYAIYLGDEEVDCVSDENKKNECALKKSGDAWLRTECGFTTYGISDEELGKLSEVFTSISELILTQASVWVASDPIGEMYDFDGFLIQPSDEDMYSYSETNHKITWNLRYCSSIQTTQDGYNVYQLSYKVKLNTLADGYTAGTPYATNGVTSVTYSVSQNGQNTQNGTAYFNVPSAKGYAANITFNKTDDKGAPLAGAVFTLTTENQEGWSKTATSNDNGVVTFETVPSGHTYMIKETTAPEGFIKDETGYSVSVAYGEVVGTIGTNNTVKNSPAQSATGSLTVSKTVSGAGASTTQAFTFTVTLTDANDSPVSGTFGDMTFDGEGVATFKLKHDESLTATGLPIGTVYSVSETDNSGYVVTINDNEASTTTGMIENTTPVIIAFNNYNSDNKADAPQTGDNSHMALWIAFLFVSGGVLIGTTVYGKKKKYSAR